MKAWIRIAMLGRLNIVGENAPPAQEKKAGGGRRRGKKGWSGGLKKKNPEIKSGYGHPAGVQGPRYAHRKKEGPGA